MTKGNEVGSSRGSAISPIGPHSYLVVIVVLEVGCGGKRPKISKDMAGTE